MELKELLERFSKKEKTDDDWLQLKADMIQFLEEDHPIEEKQKLAPLGKFETVGMMCSIIEAEREEKAKVDK